MGINVSNRPTLPYLAVFVKLVLVVWSVQHVAGLDGPTFNRLLTDLANDELGVEQFQEYLDRNVKFVESPLDGNVLVQRVATALGAKFRERITVVNELHDLIEEEYGNFNKKNTAFPECCNGVLREEDSRFKAMVNLDQVCTSGQHLSSATKFVNNKIRDAMRTNLRNNPTLKWQYFGSEEGVMTVYPSFRQCAPEYDPRFRPWYVSSATPKPKDVVVVIDTSGSMSHSEPESNTHRINIAILAANTVINTLSPNDRVGVVSFDTTPRTPPGNTQTSGCYSTTLAKATPQNKAYLEKYILHLLAKGDTHYGKAFEKAFELMGSVEADEFDEYERDKVILFLTDGEPTDHIDDIVTTIKLKNAELHNKVVILTYGIGDALGSDARNFLKRIAKQPDHDPTAGEIQIGEFTAVEEIVNLRQIMGSYYNFFSKTGQIPKAAYVVPYFDAFGLGLVTSACIPVYYDSTLIGVTCVDITVSDLLSDVTYFNEGELSYVFMIDDRARLRMHPLLPQPFAIEEDPIFVNMLSLESFQGAEEVMASMIRGEINQTGASSQRVISRGDAVFEGVETATVASTYYWYPVEDTEFSVCLAIGDADKRATVTWTDVYDGTFAYHRLDLKRPTTLLSEVCNYYTRLALKEHSTVQFSPEAFTDPYIYLSRTETVTTVDSYEVYMTGTEGSSNPGFKEGLRETVSATAYFNQLWKTAGQSNYIIWRYIGTEDGVFRVMPGSSLGKDYDHTRRPWYKRSLSQKGRLVLSTPYEDLLGAGYVLTLSKTVYEGRENLQHSTNDVVVGVIAMDFTLAYVYNLLRKPFPECQQSENTCFIIETSGFIVVHDDFVKVDASTTPQVENIHITTKEPDIAANLIERKVMTKTACVNFETLREQYFWSVYIRRDTKVVTADYEVHAVSNTNVFLVIKKFSGSRNAYCVCSRNTLSGQSGLGDCLNIDCECPCSVRTNIYEYCQDSFQLSSDSSPPCTPRVPPAQTLDSENSDELAQAQRLDQCFNYRCSTQKDPNDCMNSATCSWCSVYNDGPSLADPYCADQDKCPYGVVNKVSPNGGEDGNGSSSGVNVPAIAGASVGVLVLLLVVIGVAVCLRKRRNKTPPEPPPAYETVRHTRASRF